LNIAKFDKNILMHDYLSLEKNKRIIKKNLNKILSMKSSNKIKKGNKQTFMKKERKKEEVILAS